MRTLTADERDLAAQHVRLVPYTAKRYHPPPGYEFEDIVGVGYIGLMAAAQRFDPGRGFAFSTFAISCIHNEVRAWFRTLNTMKRGGVGNTDGGAIALRADASLDALHEQYAFDPPSPEADDDSVASDLVERVLAAAADIDRRLPGLLLARMNGATYREAGRAFGISHERARQLLVHAQVLRPLVDHAA